MSDFPYTDPPSDPASCPYCGTDIDDDENEVATGSRHYAAKCREYVFAVKQSLTRELAALRASAPREGRLPDAEGWWAHKMDGRVRWYRVIQIDELGLSVWVTDIGDHVPVARLKVGYARWFGPVALAWED